MVRDGGPCYLAQSRCSEILNLFENELTDLKRHHLVCIKPSIFSTLAKRRRIVIQQEKIEKGGTEQGDGWRNVITCLCAYIYLIVSFCFHARKMTIIAHHLCVRGAATLCPWIAQPSWSPIHKGHLPCSIPLQGQDFTVTDHAGKIRPYEKEGFVIVVG